MKPYDLFDKTMFVQIMKSHSDTRHKLAQALRVSERTLRRRISGEDFWTLREARIIQQRYQLAPIQMNNIFFRKRTAV